MVLDRTMFHYRNLAATWLDQAQRNNLLTDCSSAGTQGWEGQREKRRRRGEEKEIGERKRCRKRRREERLRRRGKEKRGEGRSEREE